MLLNFKKENGSITLFVLISMLFFMIVLMGIFVSTSNKIQKQEKEIQQIQKSYQKEDINSLYENVRTNRKANKFVVCYFKSINFN